MTYTIVYNRPTYHFYTGLQSLRSPKVIFQSYASGLFVYLKPHFLLHIVYPGLFGFTLGFSGKHPRLFCKWFSETIFGFPSISGVEYVYDYSLLLDSCCVLPRPPQHKSGVSTCPQGHCADQTDGGSVVIPICERAETGRLAWLRQKTADSLIYHSWFIGKDNSCDRDRASGLGKLNWSRTLRSKHRRRVPHGQGGTTDLVPPAAAGDTRNQVLITVHMTEVETQTRGHVCTLRSSAPCSLRARISHPRPPSSN